MKIIEMFNSQRLLFTSAIFTIFMFGVVMFIINPSIDGKDGFGVIGLQLAFFKEDAINIISSWGLKGVENFKKYIFTDYLYALGYSIFFSTLIARLIVTKNRLEYGWLIYMVILAGSFDWLENTIEIKFLENPLHFPEELIFFHSIIATWKWMILPIVLVSIFSLIAGEKEY